MLNLLVKDILIQKKNLYVSLIYILVGLFIFKDLGAGVLAVLGIAIVYIMSQGAFYLDEKSNGEVLLNSLPISRKYLVTAKYFSAYIYFFTMVIIYSIIVKVIEVFGIITPPLSNVTIESLIAAYSSMVLITAISFPAFFKYGFAKTRVLSIVIFAILFGGVSAYMAIIEELAHVELVQNIISILQNDVTVNIVILASLVLLHYISYLLSVRFYENKEF